MALQLERKEMWVPGICNLKQYVRSSWAFQVAISYLVPAFPLKELSHLAKTANADPANEDVKNPKLWDSKDKSY